MSHEQLRLSDALSVTHRAAARLRRSLRGDGADLRAAIDAETAEDAAALTKVDAFVQRCRQIVEHMTHRLFGAIYRAEELGARPPALSRLPIFLEDLRIVEAAARKVRIEIRSRLVHQYPLDPGDRAAALHDAARESAAILDEFAAIAAYVERRRLLEPSS